MLVGEKLTGGASLYSGVWDCIAPLSAFIYNGIDYLFGRSQLTYQILAYLLVCYQIFIFNSFLINSKAYTENTYVPAVIFALLSSVCYDMFTLTPFLIGLTFLLLALKNIFQHIEFRSKRDEDILNIGLFIGLATVTYQQFAIFVFCTLLIFVMFTGTVGRRYIMMLFGFFLPILIAGSYFFLTNRFTDFMYSFLSPFFVISKIWYFSFWQLMLLFALPTLYFLLALFRMTQGARLTNYQGRLTQSMLVWMVFSIGFILISDEYSPAVYLILIPVGSFFIAHHFLIYRKKIMAEISFILFLVGMVATGVLSYNTPEWLGKYFNNTDYVVNMGSYGDVAGQRILVLDDNIRPYYYAQSATPFLNWQMSEEVFNNLNYYDNLTLIYEGIVNDRPDIIIDSNNRMPKIFEKIPTLKELYFKSRDGNYHLKVSN